MPRKTETNLAARIANNMPVFFECEQNMIIFELKQTLSHKVPATTTLCHPSRPSSKTMVMTVDAVFTEPRTNSSSSAQKSWRRRTPTNVPPGSRSCQRITLRAGRERSSTPGVSRGVFFPLRRSCRRHTARPHSRSTSSPPSATQALLRSFSHTLVENQTKALEDVPLL